MIIAVIPARGQSKRLPRKNVLPFLDRPLIAWSILAALKSPSIDGCVVSTDDAEIAQVARSYGAEVVDRPPELASDESPTVDAIVHAMEVLRGKYDRWDAVITLQPTNPLRPIRLIESAIGEFRQARCDSLVSVSQEHLKTGELRDGLYQPSYAFGVQTRLMPVVTYENGLIYMSSFDTLMNERRLCGERNCGFVTEKPFADVDIDDLADFEIGEHVARAIIRHLDY